MARLYIPEEFLLDLSERVVFITGKIIRKLLATARLGPQVLIIQVARRELEERPQSSVLKRAQM